MKGRQKLPDCYKLVGGVKGDDGQWLDVLVTTDDRPRYDGTMPPFVVLCERDKDPEADGYFFTPMEASILRTYLQKAEGDVKATKEPPAEASP